MMRKGEGAEKVRTIIENEQQDTHQFVSV